MRTNGVLNGNPQRTTGDRQPATGNPGTGRPDRRGQTTTEYLMIAGIMTAIGILILLWMFEPWRATVEDVADCVRTDDCEPVGAQ